MFYLFKKIFSDFFKPYFPDKVSRGTFLLIPTLSLPFSPFIRQKQRKIKLLARSKEPYSFVYRESVTLSLSFTIPNAQDADSLIVV